VAEIPEVLFVCMHNAGRSQMAAALLVHHAAGRVRVRSAGSAPADSINPAVVQVMDELGIDLSKEFPKPLTGEAVEAADVVVTMGCGDVCPVFPGKRYLDWRLSDPAGRPVEEIRPIRDEIDRRVRGLLDEFLPDDERAAAPAGRAATPQGVTIQPMRSEDAAEILAIYQAGLDGGDASFETVAPTWEAFDRGKLPGHRHVAMDTDTGRVLGWIAVTAVSDRCVYAGVVEHSVYVHPDHHGRGIAAALLQALIDSTEAAGIWVIQSGVFPENTASLRLHAKAGFRTVGIRERLGRHRERWRDVVLIERRSTTAGAS
jgi:L-amino acid N-acyltransferase YncA/protein-tyrosine-phosphatase